jgi:hypothetical protein
MVARVLADLATLRDQGELYGPVASDPTLWRTLDGIGESQRRKIARVRAKTRLHMWSLIEKRHGAIPPSRVADRDLGKTIVIRMDASIVIAHSDKELAAGTYKGTWGHHPLMAWCDNTGESLALRLRQGSAGANTTTDHIEVLDEAISQIPARYRRDLADHRGWCRRFPRPGQPHHHPQRPTRIPGALQHRLGAGAAGTRRHQPRTPPRLRRRG